LAHNGELVGGPLAALQEPIQFDIPSPTDLALYAAPMGLLVWDSSPSVRAATYNIGSRVRSTLLGLLRAPRLYYESFTGHVFPSVSRRKSASSRNGFARARNRNNCTPAFASRFPIFAPVVEFFSRIDVDLVLETPPLGPNMCSLSGLGRCGVGAEFATRWAIPPNTSTLSQPGRCGLGTESLEPLEPHVPWTISFSTSPILWLSARDELVAITYLLVLVICHLCMSPFLYRHQFH
jgi:hypothetical protein